VADPDVASRVAVAVDAALTDRVLVIGSLPPHGRDLDLLAEQPQYEEVAAWCASAGFLSSGGLWATFDGDGAYAVDIECADHRGWGSRDPAILFADAERLAGYRHLMRPSPAVALVLAARSVVGRRGRLKDSTRARVQQALERDPRAWAGARELAGPLGLAGALRALQAAYDGGSDSLRGRTAVMTRYLVGPDSTRVKVDLLRQALPSRVRPTIVSLSGLDGSGKSTQARRLRETLQRVGVPAAGQWAGFTISPKLYAACSLMDRRSWTPAGRRQLRAVPPPADEFLPPACRTGVVAPHVWLCLVAVFNALSLWWLVLRPRSRPQVLIFDRFSPDTAVKIDYFFAVERGLDTRYERELFRFLTPKPTVGFLLTVSGELSHARRQEHWGPEELEVMAQLYEKHAPRFALRQLDGRLPEDFLHDAILRDVWRRL
jgi:thymidylate kinase